MLEGTIPDLGFGIDTLHYENWTGWEVLLDALKKKPWFEHSHNVIRDF